MGDHNHVDRSVFCSPYVPFCAFQHNFESSLSRVGIRMLVNRGGGQNGVEFVRGRRWPRWKQDQREDDRPEKVNRLESKPRRLFQHYGNFPNVCVSCCCFSSFKERDGFGSLAVPRGRGRGRGEWSVGAPGGMQEITYTVPADKCGLVIGKGVWQCGHESSWGRITWTVGGGPEENVHVFCSISLPTQHPST